jgi:hypothetical protein
MKGKLKRGRKDIKSRLRRTDRQMKYTFEVVSEDTDWILLVQSEPDVGSFEDSIEPCIL